MIDQSVSGEQFQNEHDGVDANSRPKFNPQWKYVSAFTVRQAAYLWGEHEPRDKYSLGLDIKDDGTIGRKAEPESFAANFQMLQAAIHMGKIVPVYRVYSISKQPHEEDQISRENLEAFANEIGQLPEFLFDTSLPDITSLSEPGKSVEVVNAQDFEGPTYADKDGGRPTRYHWDKIAALPAFIEEDESMEGSVADMTRRVRSEIEKDPSQFCEAGYATVPDLSVIQKRLSGMLKALRELKARRNAGKIRAKQ